MSAAAFVRCQNRSEAMKEKEEKIGNICLVLFNHGHDVRVNTNLFIFKIIIERCETQQTKLGAESAQISPQCQTWCLAPCEILVNQTQTISFQLSTSNHQVYYLHHK